MRLGLIFLVVVELTLSAQAADQPTASNAPVGPTTPASSPDSAGAVAPPGSARLLVVPTTTAPVTTDAPAPGAPKSFITHLSASPGPVGTSPFIRIYYLKQANAQQLATTLTSVTQAITKAQQAQGVSPFSPSMTIVADTRTNALIITGFSRDFTEIGGLIEHYDPGSRMATPPAPTPPAPVEAPSKDEKIPADVPAPATASKP